MQRDWILHSWWEECKMVQPVWKTSSFLENYMYTYFIIQQFHSKVFLQQKLKYMPHKYLHNSVDCSLIYNSKRFKQFKCPSTGEWISKLYYIVQRNLTQWGRQEWTISAQTWVNINIMLSEGGQTWVCSICFHVYEV